MQINNLNLFPQINKNKSQNTIKTQTNPTQDVFQKSSVSFKGSELDDAFMSLFDSLFQSLSDKLTEQFDIIKHSQKETEVGALIVAASSKEYKNVMNFYKNETFRNTVSKQSCTIEATDKHEERYFKNTNDLLFSLNLLM